MIQTIYGTADNFSLLAVSFFMIAGELMATGGIAKRLIGFAETLVGNKTGGFGMVVILACMVFAAISGSGTATAAAIGGICIPIMIEHKYTANVIKLRDLVKKSYSKSLEKPQNQAKTTTFLMGIFGVLA